MTQERESTLGKVLLELTISLDGYAAGPGVGPDQPMGKGGEELHDWMFAGKTGTEVERFQTNLFKDVGAVIVGRRMADLGIGNWGEEPVYHAPVFVVTHRPAETIEKKGGTSYTFVTDGIEAAMERARKAAGSKDVHVGGGPEIAQQFLNAGLVDEVRLHIAPMTLGSGTPAFAGLRTDLRLRPRAAECEPLATHLVYDVVRQASE
jgi:dihydrofolate reductase